MLELVACLPMAKVLEMMPRDDGVADWNILVPLKVKMIEKGFTFLS